MRKFLHKLLFVVLLVSGFALYSQTTLPGTVEVETGTVAGGASAGATNVSGLRSTSARFVTNSVTVATAGNYDFTFTYRRATSGAASATMEIVSPASTLFSGFSMPGTSGFGTVTRTNVALPAGTYDIKFFNTSGNGIALDKYEVTVAAAKPTITLLGSSPVTVSQGTTYTDAGATALAADGTTDITADIMTVNPVTTGTIGTYTVTYNVTDGGVAADEVTRTVNVVAPQTIATQTGNWNDTATWGGNPVPTSSDDVLIGNFTITVPPGVAAECNNLEIDGTAGTRIIQVKETGSLTINGNLTSDRSNDGVRLNYTNSPSTRDLGSIIIKGFTSSNGTSAGGRKAFITKRLPSNDDWHLISIGGTSASKSDILKTTGSNIVINNTKNIYSMASYNGANASGSKYEYFASGTQSGSFADMGYSIKVNNTGDTAKPDITLKPRITYEDFNETISDAGDGFNLVGNPFFAYLSANTAASTAEGTAVVGGASTNLLAENSGVLEEQTIWLWNNAKSGGAGWEIINLGDADYRIHPIQGFFVKAKSGGGTSQTLTFKETMLSHSKAGNNFLKSSSNRFEIDLSIASGERKTSTSVRYIDGTSISFDNGYDSSMFGGYTSELEVYTTLLADNTDKKLAIQSLPNSDFENMVIPVGVTAKVNSKITLSANVLNIAKGYNVVLEDRQNNVFTSLTDANAAYTTTVSETSTDGRFFLHVTSSVLSAEDEFLSSVRLFTTDNSNVRVVGLQNGNAKFQLFNILGEQVLSTSFQSRNVNNISLPTLSSGVYIVQLTTASGKLKKKIVLK